MENQYVSTYQALICQWSAELTQPELNVLLFVNERTLRYGKKRECIPMRHFLQGVVDKVGTRIIAGLRHNKNSIIKAYKSLRDRGLLLVSVGDNFKGTNEFAINFRKIVEGAAAMSKLNIGKKHKNEPKKEVEYDDFYDEGGVSERPSRGISGAQQGYLRGPANKNTYNKNTISKNTNSGQGPAEGIQEAVERAKARGLASAAKTSSTLKTRISQRALAAHWRLMVTKHHPGVAIPLAITPKQYGMFRNSLAANQLPVDLPDFIEWAVANWVEIVDYDFEWCTARPAPHIPTLSFFATMLKYFVSAYGNQQMRDSRKKQATDKSVRQAKQLKRQNDQLSSELENAKQALGTERQKAEQFKRVAADANRRLRVRASQPAATDIKIEDIDDLPEWDERG